jgi:hypothetical protein
LVGDLAMGCEIRKHSENGKLWLASKVTSAA